MPEVQPYVAATSVFNPYLHPLSNPTRLLLAVAALKGALLPHPGLVQEACTELC